jgi:SAM-dependent methyltransferase
MPPADAARWNARYRSGPHAATDGPRPFLVEAAQAGLLPATGLALDAAMGPGWNAGLLLARGLRVVGVDIAEVAVRQARARLPALMAVVADLTRFDAPPATFDVILNFYYLDRNLWPAYRRWLRPGGVLVFETLTEAMRQVRPGINPAHLLAPGELRAAFADWDVAVYREGWQPGRHGGRRAAASLVARRPAPGP